MEKNASDNNLFAHYGVPVNQGLVLSYRIGRDPVSGGERIYVGINAAPTLPHQSNTRAISSAVSG